MFSFRRPLQCRGRRLRDYASMYPRGFFLMPVKTLVQIDTVLTADSVEWCPVSSTRQLLALGTYQLDEETRKRLGSLSLYQYSHEATGDSLSQVAQSHTDSLRSGILDMKWRKDSVLALAGSDGAVTFLRVSQTLLSTDIEMLGRAELVASDVDPPSSPLCLSLDWSKTNESEIAVSDSKGQLSLIELSETGGRLSRQWSAHSYEAWIVAFGHEPSTLYSGGDDCRLCVWDLRTTCSHPALISKRHSMGVCSLQAHPTQEHLLVSGSYDEVLLLWDTRNMSKPLKEAGLGGGIWRVKWNSEQSDLLATACMHNGFQLVQCHMTSAREPEVVCMYEEHKSLAYGIDWAPSDDDGRATLASCSFYDHSMHLWTYE